MCKGALLESDRCGLELIKENAVRHGADTVLADPIKAPLHGANAQLGQAA